MDWTQTLTAAFAGDANDQQLLQEFVAKLRSFAYSPQNRAASDRLLPFSKNAALLSAIRSYLDARVGVLGNELTIIPDWSMVICLVQDASASSLQTLQRLLDHAISNNDGARLALFVRYFEQYSEQPGVAPLAAAAVARYGEIIARSSAVRWAEQLGIKYPQYPKLWSVEIAVADQPRPNGWSPPPESAHVLTLQVASRPLTSHGEFWTLKLANSSRGGTLLWWAGGDTRPCQANDGVRIVSMPEAPILASLPRFLRGLEQALAYRLDFSKAISFQAQGLRQKDLERRVLDWLASSQ